MRIVSSGILMICGACIALGIIHFRFWLMERARRDQLAFSLVCFSVSGFAAGYVTLFGESVGYPIAVPNPWMLLAQLSHLMLLIFCLDASVRAWRRGER
ncbi:MAG TPA: hypothetical protein VGC97_22330, partial [Pyrinomonadaceae bacterium]